MPEWIRRSKARLVFRYEISDLFIVVLPHAHMRSRGKAIAKAFTDIIVAEKQSAQSY